MPEYLEVVGSPRKMGGKGSPQDTLFGVIGHTKMSPLTRSLGGLVIGTSKGASPKRAAHKAHVHPDTDHNLIAGAHKTHISGAHFGQVPYAGRFMAAVGKEVS